MGSLRTLETCGFRVVECAVLQHDLGSLSGNSGCQPIGAGEAGPEYRQASLAYIALEVLLAGMDATVFDNILGATARTSWLYNYRLTIVN